MASLSKSSFILALPILIGLSNNSYSAEHFNYGHDSSNLDPKGSTLNDSENSTSPSPFPHTNNDTTGSSSNDTSPQTKTNPGPTVSSPPPRRTQQ